jgi:hypothetical protein
MERILLIEPNYQNKFPPIALMKIASYHRHRGDFVEFYKGEPPYFMVSKADRIYITSLFTFHYDLTLKCIQHCAKYTNKDKIYVGGIAATLLRSELERDAGINQIISGLLTDSSVLGYSDKVNIDRMPLDYDILDDISYCYPAGDNYFIHTTRGCPRACEFCAVKTLEPEYKTTNNIIDQVSRVDRIYGTKRNLFIMDNNILFSPKIEEIVNDIWALGFNGEASYIYPNQFISLMNKVRRRISFNSNYSRQVNEILNYLDIFQRRLFNTSRTKETFLEIVSVIKQSDNWWTELQKYEEDLAEIVEKYRYKSRLVRYVDFNQGIDARLLTNKKAKILSKISISPFRLAYDGIKHTKTFIAAMNKAIKNGISDFSNYILYNWTDRPEDLWTRLHTAIDLYNNCGVKIKAFSFPMKYAPINEKDRGFIGKHWNKKYLNSINIILNVTRGIVAKESDFFYEAFGKNIDEYYSILTMPDEFIRHRHFFRDNGLIGCWTRLYNALSAVEKNKLLEIICASKQNRSVLFENHRPKISKILTLYTVNKSQFDRSEKLAIDIMHDLEEPNQHDNEN